MTVAGCSSSLQQVGQSMADFHAQGNLTVLLCDRPDLDGCDFLENINIADGPVKINTHELPSNIGDDNLRSFSVTCGRPTGVLTYEHCNFRGRVGVFHCVPGQTLEVPYLGDLSGHVSSLVFTDETQTDDLQHTAIDLSLAVNALHQGISTVLDVGTGAGGDSSNDNCPIIPQCCTTNSGGAGSSDGGEIEEAFPIATEVYWTEPINVFDELPNLSDDGHLSRIDQCPIPSSSERQQLLAIAHHTLIDPDDWPSDYRVSLYWYFEPVLDNAGRVFLRLHRSEVLAEDGLAHDSLVSGLGSVMPDAGKALACQILSEVKLQADLSGREAAGAGLAGEDLLTNNERISWTLANPLVRNPRRRTSIPSGDYRNYPPVLILHKE
jgi:hypothetical protein